MKKPESKTVAKILDAFEEEFGSNGYFRKIHGNAFQHAGIPDIIGCLYGVFIALEVKEIGNEPSPIQIHELSLIEGAQGIQGVVYSVQDAINIVKSAISHLESNRRHRI